MKNRNRWGFQLLPSTRDILAKGFRVDAVTQEIEDEVDNALPYHFRFHKISKLVIRLGKKEEEEKDYFEHIGVAQKYYPDIDLKEYKEMTDEKKIETMKRIITEVFDWLIENFEDSQCFQEAKTKLNWSEPVGVDNY